MTGQPVANDMHQQGGIPIISDTLGLFAVTAALVAIGFVLHRRDILRGPLPTLGWALLCGIPFLVSIAHSYRIT